MAAGFSASRGFVASAVLTACLGFAGCHSPHVEMTIENRTGATIQLLEVDYPSASFGVGSLAKGQDYRYLLQVRGSGEVKVRYTDPGGHQQQITGPTLSERQEGRFVVTLLPGGKGAFHPDLHQGQ